jgi:beta-fructofuranosidase
MGNNTKTITINRRLTETQITKKSERVVVSKPIFGDAIVFWQMSRLDDATTKNNQLIGSGNVKVGVRLLGAEYDESIKRGGDGYVTEFRGGYLNAGQGPRGKLNLTGKAMSLYIRLRVPSGKWNAPLISKYGGSNRLVYRLIAKDNGTDKSLVFELGTDVYDQPISVSVPIDMIGSTSWHDVIIRYNIYKMELFVDGVLVDEEYPMGSLRQGNDEPCMIGAESYENKISSGFHGLIDHIALWNRGLSDDEINLLSGGKQETAKRKKEILGIEYPITQYWKPIGHNTNVGDCMPFYHDGLFHLFYLIDRRHHRSKWGFGAHQWAHASTPDLIRWTHQPLAIAITKEKEGSICAGSVMFHQGMYYAFYATRIPDIGECLSLATSINGIHFTKANPNPFALPEPPYRNGYYRDPSVFYDKQTGLYHLLVTAELEVSNLAGRGGCLAHLVSANMKKWDLKEPFIVPGHVGLPECPDYFLWNDWYYLIFSINGIAHYRMSKEPFGSWTKPNTDTFDGLQAMVLKTAPFKNGRRIGVASIPDKGYGGSVLFREIVQSEDGTLGTKFPEEFVSTNGRLLKPQIIALTEGVSGRGSNVRIEAVGCFSASALLDIPTNAYIRLRINPDPGSSSFGVCLRGFGNYQDGNEIRFEPYRQKLSLRKPYCNPMDENEFTSLYTVNGLDQPFDLQIIAKDDIIDICINNRRTMVSRVSKIDGDRLFLFAQNSGVTFESIEIRPVL